MAQYGKSEVPKPVACENPGYNDVFCDKYEEDSAIIGAKRSGISQGRTLKEVVM